MSSKLTDEMMIEEALGPALWGCFGADQQKDAEEMDEIERLSTDASQGPDHPA